MFVPAGAGSVGVESAVICVVWVGPSSDELPPPPPAEETEAAGTLLITMVDPREAASFPSKS